MKKNQTVIVFCFFISNTTAFKMEDVNDVLATAVAEAAKLMFGHQNAIGFYFSIDRLAHEQRTQYYYNKKEKNISVLGSTNTCSISKKHFKLDASEELDEMLLDESIQRKSLKFPWYPIFHKGVVADFQSLVLQKLQSFIPVITNPYIFDSNISPTIVRDLVIVVRNMEGHKKLEFSFYLIYHMLAFGTVVPNRILLVIVGNDLESDNLLLNALVLLPPLKFKDQTVVISMGTNPQEANVHVPKMCGVYRRKILLDIWVSNASGGEFIRNSQLVHPNSEKRNLKRCCFDASFINYSKPSPEDKIDIELLKIVSKVTGLRHWKKGCENRKIQRVSNLDFLQDNSHLAFYTTTTMALHVPRKIGTQWATMYEMFSASTWVCILLSVALAAVCLNFFSSRRQGFDFHLLNVWSSLLGTSANSIPQSTTLRVFFFSWVLYSICINTIFQAYLTTDSTIPIYKQEIDTVEQLKSMKYQVLFSNSRTYSPAAFIRDFPETHVYFKNVNDAFMYFVQTPKSAIFGNTKKLAHLAQVLCGNSYQVHVLKEFRIEIHVGYVTTLSPFKTVLNKIMSRILETGINLKITADILDPKGHNKIRSPQKESLEEYSPLFVAHVKSAFVIYFIGMCSALLIFAAELILKKYTAMDPGSLWFGSLNQSNSHNKN